MSVSNSHPSSFENQIEVLKFLDSHMVIRLLDFSLQKVANESEKENFLKYKKKVLFKTFLLDQQKQFLELNPNLAGQGEYETIEQIQENLKKKEDLSKLAIIGFLNLMENYRRNTNFDIASSISKKIVDETSVNKVLEYSKILYEKGNYTESKTLLSDFFRFSFENKKNLSRTILALWTILSINILDNNWNEIFSTFNHIKISIDLLKNNLEEEFRKISTESIDFKHILLFKSYLIHWSLFLLKEPKQGLEKFLNFIFDENYLTLIESSFNYIYKYLVVISIISKSNRNIHLLKNIFSAITYEDEFSKLFNAIYEDFNVENSLGLIEECARFMESDYFLCDYSELFVTKCKEVLIENHVDLNTLIDTNLFARFFNEELDKIKTFIVNYIKSNHSDAEIHVNDNVIKYKFKDTTKENQHILKVKELFDLTKNMIEVVKMNKI